MSSAEAESEPRTSEQPEGSTDPAAQLANVYSIPSKPDRTLFFEKRKQYKELQSQWQSVTMTTELLRLEYLDLEAREDVLRDELNLLISQFQAGDHEVAVALDRVQETPQDVERLVLISTLPQATQPSSQPARARTESSIAPSHAHVTPQQAKDVEMRIA
ncbi:uncharacterized protein L969DRAFT_91833 [Mixia osmundae IAM 14324]|uniref:Uncharacterized protein n=1 Tax=Mixia osmundae (strain CBS 9802 / IAM 14324 / JCM 22182 / KY 12970) TaxID=764103 RepID=G7E864_MIXOS|nr:uncharacterized protein L969DRAFT_91833 [Mixia osmundae IAM 14324]KEI42384.1 hypothetical protein L969DRAFT_91833 [Mixia osmundae IAM 14324]GAA99024.1 hypothetical protein E5Q_05713 [Mixia osmundae IAM 14324]